jgi:hypothetical protein
VLESRLRHRDEGGQKPPEIRSDMIVDFTALTEQSDPWPKTNDFGQAHYRKKTGANAWNPRSDEKYS